MSAPATPETAPSDTASAAPPVEATALRVLFAGTPDTALPTLRALHGSGHEVVAVLTRPDAPLGRKRVLTPSPVAAWAEDAGIEVLRASSLRPGAADEVRERIAALAPDVAVVVAYGALVPQDLLEVPAHGWLNLHFSRLPAYRGAAPVQRALMAGESEIDAVVFQLEAGLDTGPVFDGVTAAIEPGRTAGEVLAELAEAGAGLTVSVVDALAAGTARSVPQEGEPSHAPKLSLSDGLIDPADASAAVAAHANGVTPEPGAWGWLAPTAGTAPTRFKLSGAVPVDEADLDAQVRAAATGDLVPAARRVWLRTGTGAVRVDRVQPAGKAMMDAAAWARGAGTGARLLAGRALAEHRTALERARTDRVLPSQESRA